MRKYAIFSHQRMFCSLHVCLKWEHSRVFLLSFPFFLLSLVAIHNGNALLIFWIEMVLYKASETIWIWSYLVNIFPFVFFLKCAVKKRFYIIHDEDDNDEHGEWKQIGAEEEEEEENAISGIHDEGK